MNVDFKRDGQMEHLRNKLASTNPADRADADRAMTHRVRTRLGHYESNLRAYLSSGQQLPPDVLPLNS